MSEKIQFGNNVGYRINNYILKKKILEYLLNNIDQFKLKVNKVTEESNLLDIKNNNFLFCPNIVGDDYIFISIKLKDSYHACLIETKTIDFNNYNKINIISVKIRLKFDAYKGCIFEGRIINLGGCCAFVVSKPHMLYGKMFEGNDLKEDLNHVNKFIKESYIIDSNMNTILFKIAQILDIYELELFISDTMQSSKFKFSSIDFINNDLTRTYRYYFTGQDMDDKYSYLYGKLINVDVIELFAYDKSKKLRRVGIANIPDMKTSKMCNNFTSSKDFSKLYCNFDYRFKKWTPLEILIDENQEMTCYDEVCNKMLDVISH